MINVLNHHHLPHMQWPSNNFCVTKYPKVMAWFHIYFLTANWLERERNWLRWPKNLNRSWINTHTQMGGEIVNRRWLGKARVGAAVVRHRNRRTSQHHRLFSRYLRHPRIGPSRGEKSMFATMGLIRWRLETVVNFWNPGVIKQLPLLSDLESRSMKGIFKITW